MGYVFVKVVARKKGLEYSSVQKTRNIAEMLLGLNFEATESGTVPEVEIEA